MRNLLTLGGRTMIITGGAGNNGLAIINMALEQGMNVALMSASHSRAQAAIAKIDPKYRAQVVGYAQNPQARIQENMDSAPDIYKPDTTQEDVLRMIYDQFGSIDVVINGSGGHTRKNFAQTEKVDWHHSMEVLEGAFFNTKLALPYLEKSKAPRVINLTTCDGKGGGYFTDPSFSAARGGMPSLTYEMAKELGPKGITVNCVLTGHIETDTPDDALSDEARAELLAHTPIGRLGEPRDVAIAVNFLASEEASFITGAVLDVNGGVLMG